MNILLFGPPGAGKGTQSALLVERKSLKHISTGDLFRAAIKNETSLGLEAKKYMDKGELVPDAVVIGMVEEMLQQLNGQNFILDGFPRTVPQAEALDDLLAKLDMQIDQAIFLEVPRDQLLSRLAGRRVCKKCGAVYHVMTKPPKKEGVCDLCGGELLHRSDDREEVIATRLEAYDKSTQPLKEFYKDSGLLVEVEGTGSADEVYSRVDEVLNG